MSPYDETKLNRDYALLKCDYPLADHYEQKLLRMTNDELIERLKAEIEQCNLNRDSELKNGERQKAVEYGAEASAYQKVINIISLNQTPDT